MVELAKERKWLHRPIVSNRKIQIFAPLGNLMGFALGPFGFSAPHCLHLSSALALCTPAPLYPKLIAGCIAAFFLASAALSQWVQNLPFYLASPVILWVGIAMIKPLPWNVRKGGLEVIAGLVMTMSVAYTHDIALSMALGFWLALAIRFFEKKKIELASWVLALGFIAYTYLVAA
jgi:hypothetical protein